MIRQQSLVSRAMTTGQFGIAYTPQRVKDEPGKGMRPELNVCLNLELIENRPGARSTLTLMPGKSYCMYVYASNPRYASDQRPELCVTSEIELLLECTNDVTTDAAIEIENPQNIMTYQQIEQRGAIFENKEYQPFLLTIPKDYPEGSISFSLSYSTGRWRKQVASLQVKVVSPYTPFEKAARELVYIDVTAPLPPGTAYLYVTAEDSERLHLTYGYNEKLYNEDAENWRPPKLAEFAERAKSSYEAKAARSQDPVTEVVKEITNTMRSFSVRGPEKFIGWLSKFVESADEEKRLLIVDDTDFEIPWEMLEYDDEKYLGARIAVVRWAKVQHFGSHLLLKVREEEHPGSVLFYLDDIELGEQQTYAERKALGDASGTAYHTLRQMVDAITVQGTLTQVGLIYLGCHGNEGTTLGSIPSDLITYIDLHEAISQPDPRPIVFVNACDSARLTHKDGLRRVFLERYASGYIGTLGQVVSTYASKIAACLLESALTGSDGIPVAEVLRQLRAEAVAMITRQKAAGPGTSTPSIIARHEHKDLAQMEVQEKNFYFLYTFMYVFYGNPLARLRLLRKHFEGEGGV